METIATILKGINNIYTVRDEQGREYLCRIKGKKLRDIDIDKSPLLPADEVAVEPVNGTEALIISRLERKNSFSRYNLKRRLVQTLFVNVDQVVCVVSVDEPAFRPGFIDRVSLCAAGIPMVLVVNKADLPVDEETQQQLSVYGSLYEVCRVSAAAGEGLDRLEGLLKGRRSAFFGQSGVGKSTLVNLLIPEAQQKTAEVSIKYNKGRHTTNFTTLLTSPDNAFEILDTPGVREIEVPNMEPQEISHWYPEMISLLDSCRYAPCLHLHEPGCAVKQAVNEGTVDQGRYERYAKMTAEQMERSRTR